MTARLQVVHRDELCFQDTEPKPSSQPLPPGISGLLCDMGDVLYDASLWRRWLLQLLRRHGLNTNYRAFFRVWEREYLEAVHLGQVDYWEALRSFLTSSGLSSGQIDEIAAAGQARHNAWATDVRPLPGVLSTFSALANQGVALGAVANTCCTNESLQGTLKQLRLGGRFRVAVSSCSTGFALPQPQLYEQAMQALNLQPEQTAFVGHDTAELQGAKDVGLFTIAVHPDLDAEADAFLERIEDLATLFAEQVPSQAVM